MLVVFLPISRKNLCAPLCSRKEAALTILKLSVIGACGVHASCLKLKAALSPVSMPTSPPGLRCKSKAGYHNSCSECQCRIATRVFHTSLRTGIPRNNSRAGSMVLQWLLKSTSLQMRHSFVRCSAYRTDGVLPAFNGSCDTKQCL